MSEPTRPGSSGVPDAAPDDAERARLLRRIADLEAAVAELPTVQAILAEVRESESRYRRIVEDQTELVARWRPGFELSFANQAYCRCFGLDPAAVVGRSFLDFVPAEDHPAIVAKTRRLTPDAPIAEDRHRAIKADGSVVWQHWIDKALFDAAGRPVEYLSVGRDVTALKRSEEALQRSVARYRLALDAVGEGAYDWQLDTGEVWVSGRWLGLTGFAREEVEPTPAFWDELIHPEDRPRVRAELAEHLAGRTPEFDCEYRLRNKSGEYGWIRDRGRVVERSPDGRPLRMVGTDADVDALRRSEKRLEATRRQAARLGRLAVLNELASGIAHEVRQPLASVRNYLLAMHNLLKQTRGKHRAKLLEWTEEAAAVAERGAEAVRRWRDFVRLGETRREPVDLRRTLLEGLELLGFEIRRRGVRVEARVPDGPLSCLGDPVQFQQVVVNLTTNALEAVAEEPPERRRVAWSAERTAEGSVVLEIRDQGPGLPTERLFDAAPGEPLPSTKPDGAGLGLAICKMLVEAHGGELSGRNLPEGGAAFRVRLPAAPGPPPTSLDAT